MTRRLYVANRGEIARRIIATARKLGIETVVGVSQADEDSLAAKEADEAIVIGPPEAARSYLDIDTQVHAAKATGCQALHPGYGFLSERSAFARRCEEHGLIFVGPRSETIDAIGDKLSARKAAAAAGVPLTEGSEGTSDLKAALAAATRIGYPVITKASAGGGGRGMVIAQGPGELRRGFDAAVRAAKDAFGDGTLFLEAYVEDARHIEVQVVGDGEGGVLHFGERDCSAQRRYQKMLEEAPATILPASIRERMHEAAVSLLRGIAYRNAGTVEFLYDAKRELFSFMEVNARIQVEHPVSEEIYGVDLIEQQLRVALEIDPLRATPAPRGCAIEARILAEDPLCDFVPSPGRIEAWHIPDGPGIRVDSAVGEGSFVPPYYDSMIAKLIVHGEHREEAVERLRAALDGFLIEGIATNLSFLRFVAGHADFAASGINTTWLERIAIPEFRATAS